MIYSYEQFIEIIQWINEVRKEDAMIKKYEGIYQREIERESQHQREYKFL